MKYLEVYRVGVAKGQFSSNLEGFIRDAESDTDEDGVRALCGNLFSWEAFRYFRERKLVGEKFHFFWETESVFSQWHKVEFSASSAMYLDGEHRRKYIGQTPDKLIFSSAEQFMMYQKAMLFLDLDTAKKIMATSNPREIKRYGREVTNYDEEVWKYFRGDIVYQANFEKFSQNEKFMNELILTKGKTLVEAAPNDCTWGIGLSVDSMDAADRKLWKGENLLGEILTYIRLEKIGA